MSHHTNDTAHPKTDGPSYDDINTPVILLIGAVSAISTLLVVMFVQGLCYHLQNSYLKQRSTEVVHRPSRELIDTQKSVLAGSEGITSIEETMKKVVSTYGK